MLGLLVGEGGCDGPGVRVQWMEGVGGVNFMLLVGGG